MKHAKRYLIAQAAIMYLSQLPLLIFIILEMIPVTLSDGVTSAFIGMIVAGWVITFSSSVACAVLSLVSAFKKPENPLKTSMIVKLALIPWYLINFSFCFLLVAAMLNPFLLIGIPLLILIASFLTYVNMLATSCPTFAYMISDMIRNKKKPDGWTIASLIFHFVFCMDAIGAIILYVLSKKKEQIE